MGSDAAESVRIGIPEGEEEAYIVGVEAVISRIGAQAENNKTKIKSSIGTVLLSNFLPNFVCNLILFMVTPVNFSVDEGCSLMIILTTFGLPDRKQNLVLAGLLSVRGR